jgi:hypothetical protein
MFLNLSEGDGCLVGSGFQRRVADATLVIKRCIPCVIGRRNTV